MSRLASHTIYFYALIFIITFIGCKSVYLTSAKLYMQQQNYPKAVEFLEQEVTNNPTNAEAYYLLGYCYAQKDQFVEMDKAFKASVKISNIYEEDIKHIRSIYWLDYFNIGLNKMQDGKTEEAIVDFKTAILIDSTAADAYKNLAHAQKELKDYESAIKNYEKAVALEPYNRISLVVLGKEYITLKKYPKAIEVFNKLMELDHGSKEGIIHITYCYDQMGEREKAINIYNDAIEKNDHDPDLFFNRGRLFFLDKNFEYSIKDFSKVVELNSEDFEATYLLGSSYLNLGEKSLNKYMDLEEQNADTSQISVLKKSEAQNFQNARIYLEKANKINSNSSDLWNKLGIVYDKLTMPEESKKAFEKANELKKNELLKN